MADQKLSVLAPVANPVYDSAPDSPAKKLVDKIFTIFDPEGTGVIDDGKLDDVDKKDGKAADQVLSHYDKTLSVFDLKKARGDAKIDPNDANKVISQNDLAKLLGGQNPGQIDVTITKDDAIKHLAADKNDLKTVQDFLAGKVKPDKPKKEDSDARYSVEYYDSSKDSQKTPREKAYEKSYMVDDPDLRSTPKKKESEKIKAPKSHRIDDGYDDDDKRFSPGRL